MNNIKFSIGGMCAYASVSLYVTCMLFGLIVTEIGMC